MEPPAKPIHGQTSLFQVYLRLRPPIYQNVDSQTPKQEGYLIIEHPSPSCGSHGSSESRAGPTHITVQPPNDSRKRAVERFAFTKVFEEHATQLDVFNGTGMVSLLHGVLGERRDGLIATLGVTGSGKV